ncbi:hypothetical protein ACSDR0_51075, partial [Streptosporangium sp. G11]|uniref:hypothetical protein n=1 Tax=Streptosporangium sp. G11 TaxID=3436926 RepID=UPI003EB70741
AIAMAYQDGRAPRRRIPLISTPYRLSEAKVGTNGTVAGLTTSPFAPLGIPMKPHQAGRLRQQAPELGQLRMRVAELFEKEEGRLPFVVFQVLQYIGHADAGFLRPDVDGTEPGSFQKQGILEVHSLIVPGHGGKPQLKHS